MNDDIVEFIEAQLAHDKAEAEAARDAHVGYYAVEGDAEWCVSDGGEGVHTEPHGLKVVVGSFDHLTDSVAHHIARHDPARALADVAFMRRIIELHTTGVYRTYQCGNGDHIQEWQCERANEPYTEHRYCEVCGNECIEVPLLAEIWADQPGYKPEWRVS